MPLSSEDLQQIAARTLAHYEQHAQSYGEGTREHDVRQNIAALLKHIPGPPPFDLLDFGCGPGRDLHTFTALGHRAVGLEGAPSAAALARTHSCCEVFASNPFSYQVDLTSRVTSPYRIAVPTFRMTNRTPRT